MMQFTFIDQDKLQADITKLETQIERTKLKLRTEKQQLKQLNSFKTEERQNGKT